MNGRTRGAGRQAPAAATRATLVGLTFLAGVFAPVAAAFASDPADAIPDSASVEVQGRFHERGGVEASRVRVRPAPAGADCEFTAPVVAVDATGEAIEAMGVRFVLAPGCEVKSATGQIIALTSIAAGTWIDMDGRYADERLVITRVHVRPEPARYVEIDGPLTGRGPGKGAFQVAGLPVRLSRKSVLQGELVPVRHAIELRYAVDDDDARPTTLHIAGDRVVMGGTLEGDVQPEQNFDLSPARRTDVVGSKWNADAEAVARPAEDVLAFVKGGLNGTWILRDQQNQKISDAAWRLDEGYVMWRPSALPMVALQAGRQDFDEPREWLYDENLDAVRLHVQLGSTRAEASLSSRWGAGSPFVKGWRNEMLVSHTEIIPDWTGGAYVIHREKPGDRGNRATWFGVRSFGRVTSPVRHWAEWSFLRGRLDGYDTRAYAFDVGGRVRLHRASRLSVSAGVALGSGGQEPGDLYRQTGFNDNNDKFGGVASFKYYGELLEPQLSNLRVLTAAVGFRPSPASSIDLIFHRYDQVHELALLAGSNLRARPLGVDREIGMEWDVDAAFREIARVDLEYVFGVFLPGSAFASTARPAYLNRLDFRYKF